MMNRVGTRSLLRVLWIVGLLLTQDMRAERVCGDFNNPNINGGREPLGFYGKPMLGVLMSQIDGDQASGFKKFGYQLGIATGYRWKQQGFGALEMQMSLTERGSRRAFDPITFVNAFHIRCRQAEIQVAAVNRLNVQGIGSLDLIGGIRLSRLLSVEETEGYNPGIAEDFRKYGLMLEGGVGYGMNNHWDLRLTMNYSLRSLAYNKNQNLFYPTGVYHNGVGITALYKIGG